MQFFHIFLISYAIQGHPIERTFLLESSEQCEVALRANEPLINMLGADAFCIDTGQLSSSIRPRLRPSAQSVGHQ